jgi:hypothetical protein
MFVSTFHNVRKNFARGLYAIVRTVAPMAYAEDGLISVHSHAFMNDPAFVNAYARGVKANGGTDTYRWHWRVHIGLWVAKMALGLEGDFVECGVNTGFLSSSIMGFWCICGQQSVCGPQTPLGSVSSVIGNGLN